MSCQSQLPAGSGSTGCTVYLCTHLTVHRAKDTSGAPGRDTHSTTGCGTIGYLERSVSAPSRTLSVNIGRILSGAFLMATWLSTQVDGKLRIKKAARQIRFSLQQPKSTSPTTPFPHPPPILDSGPRTLTTVRTILPLRRPRRAAMDPKHASCHASRIKSAWRNAGELVHGRRRQ